MSIADIGALVANYGLALVFVNVFLVQAGVPVPAVPTLVVAGALAAGGTVSAPLVVLVAIAGSLAGDLIWYWIGRVAGYRVLAWLCRVSLSPDSCVKRTENIFERWGPTSLVVAKFVPGFATVAPPLAGAMRLALAPFLVYSAVSAGLWALAAVGAGMIFSRQVDWLLERLGAMGGRALVLVAAALALFALVKWWERVRFLREMRMARITPAELGELIAAGADPVILDVRSVSARRLDPRAIPGARPVDPDAPDPHLAGVPPEHEVVVYCS